MSALRMRGALVVDGEVRALLQRTGGRHDGLWVLVRFPLDHAPAAGWLRDLLRSIGQPWPREMVVDTDSLRVLDPELVGDVDWGIAAPALRSAAAVGAVTRLEA